MGLDWGQVDGGYLGFRVMNGTLNKGEAMTRLEQLLESGLVYSDGNNYIGKASDGQEVAIGTVGDEKRTNEYLESYPSPSDW